MMAHKGFKDRLALQGLQVRRDAPDLLVLRVPLGQMASQVLQGPLVLWVEQVLQAQLDLRECLVLQVLRVREEMMALPELRVPPDHAEPRVSQDLLARWARPVLPLN